MTVEQGGAQIDSLKKVLYNRQENITFKQPPNKVFLSLFDNMNAFLF
jgi:hypothetical protein